MPSGNRRCTRTSTARASIAAPPAGEHAHTGHILIKPYTVDQSCRYRDAGVNVNWDTLNGDDAATAIVDFVATRSSPLLAMTTYGRTGLATSTDATTFDEIVDVADHALLNAKAAGRNRVVLAASD